MDLGEYQCKRTMCSASYMPVPTPLIDGYTLIALNPGNTDGFRALVYRRDRSVVVVIRGTVLSSLPDWQQNVRIGVHLIPHYVTVDIPLFLRTCRDRRLIVDGDVLSFTGHSLGGGQRVT